MIELDNLKRYITHEDRQVREFAVKYFVDGHIADEDITPLVLDAYENDLDKEEAGLLLYYASRLPQTSETLKRVYNLEPVDINAVLHIDNILAYADLEFLRQHSNIRPRMDNANNILNERFYLSTVETRDLWNKLWKHSKSGEGANYQEFDYSYGNLIIGELVKRTDFPMDELKEKLKTYYPPEYTGWDDTFLSYLVGELRLTETIPFLINNLKRQGDFLCDSSQEALIKIGTSEVVKAIHNEYFKGSDHFRLNSAIVLKNTKVPESEEIIIDILPKEKNISIKTLLANALCAQLSVKGIPLVMNLINKGYDRIMVSLEKQMYVNCIINNIDRPELLKWREEIKAHELEVKEAKEKFEKGDFSVEDFKDSLEELYKKMNERKELKELYSGKEKVGRNDPCPCGSGKKYKKCCLK